MIPNTFPQNQVPQMQNYKEFYQNNIPMPMNNQNSMNPMIQPQNQNNFQMPQQMSTPKMANNQPNIISSNFIPNKDFHNRKDLYLNKNPNNKMSMQQRPPQGFHHKMDPMNQRSTKIMKMPMANGPRKMDFFKQSNYRKNNTFVQQDSLSDMDDNPMKMGKFMRPPMNMVQKPMPMQMRKQKFPNPDAMKMKPQGFFPNYPMDNGMNMQFNNNMRMGFQDQGDDGFGFKNQKRTSLISSQTFFKTKMCPHLINGNCTKGIKCNYAHSLEEIREPPNLKKTKICQMFSMGRCHLGSNCQFAHGEVELRSTPNLFKTSLCTVFAKTNNCPHGDKCRYAHGEHDIRPPFENFFNQNNGQNQNQNFQNMQNMQNQDMDGFQPLNFNSNQSDQMGFNPEGNYSNFNLQTYPNANNENLFKNNGSGFNNLINNSNYNGNKGPNQPFPHQQQNTNNINIPQNEPEGGEIKN